MSGSGYLAVPAAAVLALVGCGVSAARHAHGHRPSPVAQAQATHEYPSPPSPRQRANGSWATPASAVSAFVSGYINWDAGTVAADMRALAAHSVGQARAATQLAAAETAGDYELQRGGVANIGTIEAISPLAGHAGQFVVVTKELTTATATTAYQGLAPAWHVAIATVTAMHGRWVVSGWQPQS